MFKVQARICATCIYTWPLDELRRLLEYIADPAMPGFFDGYRQCHHTPDNSKICCRGFWNAHKNDFQAGQIAQRLNLVEFVDVDVMGDDDALREPDAGAG
jgi:cellulose synthase/poly-beta-1,6-N-acetylglucosamine synthase-like glycosyltransferase